MLCIPVGEGARVLSAAVVILPQLTGDGPATIYEITKVSLQQSIAPERMLGRVSASMKFIGLGAALAGSILGCLLGERIGVGATLSAGACGCRVVAQLLGF